MTSKSIAVVFDLVFIEYQGFLVEKLGAILLYGFIDFETLCIEPEMFKAPSLYFQMKCNDFSNKRHISVYESGKKLLLFILFDY